MSRMDLSLAKDKAASVIKKYKPGIPVDLNKIIKALDAELRYVGMPREAEGLCLKIRSNIAILINSVLRNTKLGRLVMAHGLGYVFLDIKKPMEIAFNMKSSRKNNPSVNTFALSLLMPEQHFREMIKNGSSMKDLADTYDVRIGDVKERLSYLKQGDTGELSP